MPQKDLTTKMILPAAAQSKTHTPTDAHFRRLDPELDEEDTPHDQRASMWAHS